MEKKVKQEYGQIKFEEVQQPYQPYSQSFNKLSKRRRDKKQKVLEKMQCIDQSIKIESSFSKAMKQRPRNVRLRKHLINQQQIERMIKFKVSEKITDITNKVLFPILMGPHPIYTVQLDMSNNQRFQSVELRQKLTQWIRVYFAEKNLLKKKKSKVFKSSQIVETKNVKIVQKQQVIKDKKISSRVGSTYNKYSLEFKKQLVKKIQMKIQQEKPNQKSLRHYISMQAKALNIHPKNIIRWFDTNDLDRKQGGRKAKYPVLQYRLANFVKENTNCRRREIINQAKRILKQLGGDQTFNFSKGWYQRFKNRLKDDKVTRCMQRILYDGEKQPKNNLRPNQIQATLNAQNIQNREQTQDIFCSDQEQEETKYKKQMGQCKIQESNERPVKIEYNYDQGVSNNQYFFKSEDMPFQKLRY